MNVFPSTGSWAAWESQASPWQRWPADDPLQELTSYEDVAQMLKSPNALCVELHPRIERLASRASRDYSSLASLMSGIMLFRNPPFHSDARKLLGEFLRRIASEISAEKISAVIHRELARYHQTESIDAIPKLCDHIPVCIMAMLLGLSRENANAISTDGRKIALAWLPGIPLRAFDAYEQHARAIEQALVNEMSGRHQPRSPELELLLELNRSGPGYDDRTLAALLYFLVLAGIETTGSLLGTMLHVLATDENLQEHLRQETSSIPRFIEEVLRVAPPAYKVLRRIAAPEVIAGRKFDAGQLFVCNIGRAQQDPKVFSYPDRFDMTRPPVPLLAFSTGPHTCLGAHLARMEAKIFLIELLGRCRFLAQPFQPAWEDHPIFRRLKQLPLTLIPC
jgi:pimeloyl-[acyl-carrier protein] synthase